MKFTTYMISAFAGVQLSQAIQSQVTAEKSLPNVGKVLSKPKEIFTKMNKHVSSLESRLAEVQHQNMQNIGIQKREYEANLTKQKEHHHKIERTNSNLKLDVDHLQHSIDRLRVSARDLESRNALLVVDVRRVQANITTAQEFTKDALNSSEAMLYTASELEVLTELSKKEQIMSSERDHSNRLHEVGGSSAVSLLQVSKGQDPHNILELMTSALAELSEEQNASETALKESFLAEYSESTEKTAALLKTQDELNQTKYAAIELQDKLVIAVEHLQSTHRQLKERSESLHSFALRLGSKKLPNAKGLSLLQEDDTFSLLQLTSATAKAADLDLKKHIDGTLPSVKKVTEKSTVLASKIGSKVADLEAVVASAQQVTTQGMKKEKARFESQLEAQAKRNLDLDRSNKKFGMKLRVMKRSNVILRTEAKTLMTSCDKFRAKLKHLSANLTLAEDFAQDAHSHSDHNLVNASEISVLNDLEAADHARQDAEDTVARFASISSSMDAVLLAVDTQLNAKPSKKEATDNLAMKDKVADLLKSMQATLQNVQTERNASKATLQSKFESEFTKGEYHYEELLIEQGELNATYTAQAEISKRLHEAVEHLTGQEKDLKTNFHNLYFYLQKVGNVVVNTVTTAHTVKHAAGVVSGLNQTHGHHKSVATDAHMQSGHSRSHQMVEKHRTASHGAKHHGVAGANSTDSTAEQPPAQPAVEPEQTQKQSSVLSWLR